MLDFISDKDQLSFIFQEINQPLLPSTSSHVVSSRYHIPLGSSNLSSSFRMSKHKQHNRVSHQSRFVLSQTKKGYVCTYIVVIYIGVGEVYNLG